MDHSKLFRTYMVQKNQHIVNHTYAQYIQKDTPACPTTCLLPQTLSVPQPDHSFSTKDTEKPLNKSTPNIDYAIETDFTFTHYIKMTGCI